MLPDICHHQFFVERDFQLKSINSNYRSYLRQKKPELFCAAAHWPSERMHFNLHGKIKHDLDKEFNHLSLPQNANV